MSVRQKIPYADWLLGSFMFLLCAGLTVLQYRWTGEVARAEMSRLRGNLAEQARALAREFDAELGASCDQLTPDRTDFANQTREAAHLARFKEWRAMKPRAIFSRIAIAESVDNQVQLSVLDQAAARFDRTNWPPEWSALQENLTAKFGRGSPPFSDKRGCLLEFPVRGSSGREHWLILELDLAYTREHWLPELAAKSLNPGERPIHDLRVKTGDVLPLYTTTTEPAPVASEVISVRFNQLGKSERNSRGPGSSSGAWMLETWPRPGALEATVAASRRRNLGVAVCINLLMFATGIALVYHTRRSRKLVEQQMSFVAGVSHELRTPLTVIRGAAHNLKRGVVSERGQVEKYSGLIIEHVEQLGEMIEQVLTLAGAQKNTSAALRQPVSLADVLRDAVAATTHDTQAAHCDVQLELPPALPEISGDAAALRRAFQNLITNAAKHGGTGKWIGVTAVGDEDSQPPTIEIQVADRGPGIPASEQPDIFQPFFRGAATQAKQIRGSGLGLSLVKEIVEAHGGTVSVRSTNGHGATFIVRLPSTKPEVAK